MWWLIPIRYSWNTECQSSRNSLVKDHSRPECRGWWCRQSRILSFHRFQWSWSRCGRWESCLIAAIITGLVFSVYSAFSQYLTGFDDTLKFIQEKEKKLWYFPIIWLYQTINYLTNKNHSNKLIYMKIKSISFGDIPFRMFRNLTINISERLTVIGVIMVLVNPL